MGWIQALASGHDDIDRLPQAQVIAEVFPFQVYKPAFDIVGLAEAALRESRVRVTTAISNSGYQLPDRRYVVNPGPQSA